MDVDDKNENAAGPDEAEAEAPAESGESQTPRSRVPGGRLGLALIGVALAVGLVAAGFGIAQLVDRDTIESTSSQAAEAAEPADGASSTPAEPATPDAPDPAPSSEPDAVAPQLEELERLYDEFRERLREDFEFPFDALPENLPGLDSLPFDSDELEQWLDRLAERFGDEFFPGPEHEGDSEESQLEA